MAEPRPSIPSRDAPKMDKKDSSSSLLKDEKDEKEIVAKGIRYKKADFRCSVCKSELDVMSFSLKDKALYCGACAVKKFGAKCCACGGQIKTSFTKIFDKDWHDECFRCDGCKKIFETVENIGDIGGRPYCDKCYDAYDTGKCSVCEETIGKGELVETMGEKFHAKCFVCAEGHEMKLGNFWKHEGKIYCQEHWEKSGLVDACYVCRKLIDSEYVKVLGKCLHTHCFKCRTCKKVIPGSDLAQLGGNWYCLGCAKTGKFEGLPPGTVVKGYFNAAGVWVPAPGCTAEPQMIKAKRLIRGYGEYEAAPGTVPPWESPCYPLAVLRLRPPKIPKEIDFRQREQYLEDSVFFEVFKMDIPTFNSLPLWRRLMLKKEQDLF